MSYITNDLAADVMAFEKDNEKAASRSAAINARCDELADERIADPAAVADAADYPHFWTELADLLSATSNDDRLAKLAHLRDRIHFTLSALAIKEATNDIDNPS